MWTTVRSMLTTALNGAFGTGVIKKLCAEARDEGIAIANKILKATDVGDKRVAIRKPPAALSTGRILRVEMA